MRLASASHWQKHLSDIRRWQICTFNSYFVQKVIKIKCQLKLRKTFTLRTPLSLAGELCAGTKRLVCKQGGGSAPRWSEKRGREAWPGHRLGLRWEVASPLGQLAGQGSPGPLSALTSMQINWMLSLTWRAVHPAQGPHHTLTADQAHSARCSYSQELPGSHQLGAILETGLCQEPTGQMGLQQSVRESEQGRPL